MIEKLKVIGKSLIALAKKMEKEPKGTPLKIESVGLEIRYVEDTYLSGVLNGSIIP